MKRESSQTEDRKQAALRRAEDRKRAAQVIRVASQLLDDPETAECFARDTARTLYLLWRRRHLVGRPGFAASCSMIGKRIDGIKPNTADELAKCFPANHGCGDFTEPDVAGFCAEFGEYFLRPIKKYVAFEIVAK